MKPLEHQIYDYVLQIAVQGGLVDVYATVANFADLAPSVAPELLREKIESAVVTLNAHAVWVPPRQSDAPVHDFTSQCVLSGRVERVDRRVAIDRLHGCSLTTVSTPTLYGGEEIAVMAEVFHQAWKTAEERGWTGHDPGMTRRLLAIYILGQAQEIGFDRNELQASALSFLTDTHRRSIMRSIG